MWVEETKNGKFRLYERYVDPLTGKKKKASVMMDKNTPQAINKARPMLLDKIAEKTDVKILKKKNITLGELADEYLEYKSHFLSRNSMISYRKVILRFVNEFGSSTIIDRVNRKSVQNYYLSFSETQRLSSIKNYFVIAKGMFNYAKDNGYINETPFEGIKLTSEVESKNVEDNYLTKDEREEVLQLSYKQNERYALLVDWLLNSGMRLSEALGLQYNKIQGDVIKINQQLQYGELTKPKTISSVRDIYATRRMMEIIERTKELNYPYIEPDDFIFQSRYHTFFKPQDITGFLRRISKKTSFNKPLHSHMFRHTHISILAENNVNIKAIMKRVGHSSPDTTMKIYAHITERMEKEMRNKLDDIF